MVEPRPWARATVVVSVLLASACLDPAAPNALVPATVIDDPLLPAAAITVAGRERWVHVREYGDPEAPPLFVIHGSASDMRAYLPLTYLADRYHVVLWDLRGNGLSQRVGREELAFTHMVEEIDAMRRLYAGDQPVTLIGHSWSAAFVTMYLGRYPERVRQAVLIEPPGLTGAYQREVGLALSLFSPGYLQLLWGNDGLFPSDHARLDYKLLGMLESGVRDFFCDPSRRPPQPVWRAGGVALMTWEAAILRGGRIRDYDFTVGLERFEPEVLLIGTECSPIGTDFQARTNVEAFNRVRLVDIEDSGHRLISEQFTSLRAALDDYLEVEA